MKPRFKKGSGLPEKFKPPSDPLEDEKKNRDLEPRGDWKEKKVIEYFEKKAQELGIEPDEFRDKKKKVFQKLIWQLETDNWPQDFDQKAKREYIIEFVNWMLGKSHYNSDLKTTPWGRARLVGDSISEYIETLVGKKTNYELAIQKLRCFIPSDIDTAWLYFKFIVTKIPHLDTKSPVAHNGKIDPDAYDWDFYPELDWWLKINQGWKPVNPGTKPEKDQLPERFDPTRNNVLSKGDYQNRVGEVFVDRDRFSALGVIGSGDRYIDKKTFPTTPDPNPSYFDSHPMGDPGAAEKTSGPGLMKKPKEPETPKPTPDEPIPVDKTLITTSSPSSSSPPPEPEFKPIEPPSSSSSSSSSSAFNLQHHEYLLGKNPYPRPEKRKEGEKEFDFDKRIEDWITHEINMGRFMPHQTTLETSKEFAKRLEDYVSGGKGNIPITIAKAEIHYDNPPNVQQLLEQTKKHKKRQQELKVLKQHDRLLKGLTGMRKEMKSAGAKSKKYSEDVINAITGHFTKLHESERRQHVLPLEAAQEKERETLRQYSEFKNKHHNEMRLHKEVTEKLEKELRDLRETERVFRETAEFEKAPLNNKIKSVEEELTLSQSKLAYAEAQAQEAKNNYIKAFEENKKLKGEMTEMKKGHSFEIDTLEDEVEGLKETIQQKEKEQLSSLSKSLLEQRELERQILENKKEIEKYKLGIASKKEKISQVENEVLRVEREKLMLQSDQKTEKALLENRISSLEQQKLQAESKLVEAEGLLALASRKEASLSESSVTLSKEAEALQARNLGLAEEKTYLENQLIQAQFKLQQALQENQINVSLKEEIRIAAERIKQTEQEAIHHRGLVAQQEYRIQEELKKEEQLTSSLVNAIQSMQQVLSTSFPHEPGTQYPEPVDPKQLERYFESNEPGAAVARDVWNKFQELKQKLEEANAKNFLGSNEMNQLLSRYNDLQNQMRVFGEEEEAAQQAREILNNPTPVNFEPVEVSMEEKADPELNAAKIKYEQNLRKALTIALKSGLEKSQTNPHNKAALDMIERYMRSTQEDINDLIKKSITDQGMIEEIEKTSAKHLLTRIHTDKELKAKAQNSKLRMGTLAKEWRKLTLERIIEISRSSASGEPGSKRKR